MNDIREKDAIPSYSMVDREKQKAALSKALEAGKESGLGGRYRSFE